jgi:hypothetical protein
MTRKAKTKAKWKPGQNRPAASHSSIGWPPLGCFTKDSVQSKTLHRADLIRSRRGFQSTDSPEPAPSPRPPIFATGATPQRTIATYHNLLP